MRFIQKFDNAKGMSPYKYDNGKIYMIESAIGECCYIGSTIKSLEHRFSQHCSDYRRGRYKASAEVLQYIDAEIILILKYPCKSKYELHRKEGEFIKNHGNCVNKVVAGRTGKEYRDTHKIAIQQQRKGYRDTHKTQIALRDKMYHQKNKETIKIKKKLYYEKNKEKICERRNKRIMCECGIEYTLGNKLRHKKSKRHLTLLNQFHQDS